MIAKTVSKTAALKIARAQVGQLYSNGRGQYGFNTFDTDRDCWLMGCSQPYAAARRSRADAVAIRALLAQGVEYEDAYRSVYA
jgi:hypothetical protein